MGTNRSLYGKIVEPLLHQNCTKEGSFHGSIVRDIFIRYVSCGNWVVDTQAEQLLLELVSEGVLEVTSRAPTLSQAAFIGLSYTKTQYESLPLLTPGVVEHNWFRWRKNLQVLV